MIPCKFELTGNVELQAQFSALQDRIQKRVLIKALKGCTKPLESKMKELCPVSKEGVSGERLESRNHPAGYLRATIGTIVGKGDKYPVVWVRPRFGNGHDPWYEHFPMAGTKFMTKQPTPFVDMAWDQMGPEIEASLKDDLEKNIQAEIDRL
jgi:HK97 gp10 family phage protein